MNKIRNTIRSLIFCSPFNKMLLAVNNVIRNKNVNERTIVSKWIVEYLGTLCSLRKVNSSMEQETGRLVELVKQGSEAEFTI